MPINIPRLDRILMRNTVDPPRSAVDVWNRISWLGSPIGHTGEGAWPVYSHGYQADILRVKVLYNLDQRYRQTLVSSRAAFDEELVFLFEQRIELEALIPRIRRELATEMAKLRSKPTYSMGYQIGFTSYANIGINEDRKSTQIRFDENNRVLEQQQERLKDLTFQLACYRQIIESRPPPSVSSANNEENPKSHGRYPGVPSTADPRTRDPQPLYNTPSNGDPSSLGGRRKIRKQTKKVRKHRRRRTSRS
jgi:hypothetical protein